MADNLRLMAVLAHPDDESLEDELLEELGLEDPDDDASPDADAAAGSEPEAELDDPVRLSLR